MVSGLALALAIRLIMIGLTKKIKLDREIQRPFECGFNSADPGTLPFRLRFFLLAIVFLIFDVELVILFPFLTKLSHVQSWSLVILFVFFLLFLSIGLFHE